MMLWVAFIALVVDATMVTIFMIREQNKPTVQLVRLIFGVTSAIGAIGVWQVLP